MDYLLEKIKKSKRVFLFLDYDGTLTPIVKSPQAARFSPTIRKIIHKLSRNKKFILGIISGRALKDIKRKIKVKNIIYAGNHGLELEIKGRSFLLTNLPRQEFVRKIRSIENSLKRKLFHIKGVIFENKEIILAVHYRNVKKDSVRKFHYLFKKAIQAYLNSKLFRLGRGKKVYELKPNIFFNKAEAVKLLEKKLNKKEGEITVYIGDDLTDEDVFRTLGRKDLGIRVGRNKNSAAKYFLKSSKEVEKLLGYFLKA